MSRFVITLTGTAPMLMHNARLSDPLDPIVKEMKKLTGKHSKTDDDHGRIAQLEFLGGLYHDETDGPFVPSANIFKCLRDAAKTRKMQPKVVQGVIFTTLNNKLEYSGPRDAVALYKDDNFTHRCSAKVGMQRVMRTRPIFRDWSVSAIGMIDPEVMDLANLVDFARIAGERIGLGDWRPQYGRFLSTVEEIHG